jgi:hypothetical protein
VTNRITAAGSGVAAVVVLAGLVPEGPSFEPGHTEIAGTQIATSAADGSWSAMLERNDTMQPAGTLWRITERLSRALPGQPDRVHYLRVPGSGTYTLDAISQPVPDGVMVQPNVHINPAGGISSGANTDQLAGTAGFWASGLSALVGGVAGPVYDRGGETVSLADPRFGMVFDGGYITDGSLAAGGSVLSSPSQSFTWGGLAAGQAVHIPGAGAGGAMLHTTIASVSTAPASVTLAAPNASGTSLTGVEVHVGTDNTAALAAAITAAIAAGGRLSCPPAACFVTNTQTLTADGLHELDLNHSRLLSYAAGQDFFLSNIDLHDIELHNGWVRGFPDPSNSGGTLVRFRGAQNGMGAATNADQDEINLHHLRCSGLGVGVAYLVGVAHPHLWQVHAIKCGAVVNFIGCSDGFALDNTADGQNFVTTFSVVLACNVQEANTTTTPHNVNITIARNQVKQYPAAEAILVHDLQGGLITGNTCTAVASGLIIGVSLNTPHRVSGVKAYGNYFSGHPAVAAGANWHTGIVVLGQSGGSFPWTVTDCMITDNDVVGFNQFRHQLEGGLYCAGGVSDCDLSGNRLRNNYGEQLLISTVNGPLARVKLLNTSGGAVQVGAGTEQTQLMFLEASQGITDLTLSGSQFFGPAAYAVALGSGVDVSAVPVENVRFRDQTHNWPVLQGGAKLPLFPDGAYTFAPIGTPTATSAIGIGSDGLGTVTVEAGSSDQAGTLSVTTGATPSAGIRWCQVTPGTFLPNGALRGVQVYPLDALTAALGPFWAENYLPQNGVWQLRSTGTPAGGGATYRVGYRCQTVALAN